jgi:hypothetical protein
VTRMCNTQNIGTIGHKAVVVQPYEKRPMRCELLNGRGSYREDWVEPSHRPNSDTKSVNFFTSVTP